MIHCKLIQNGQPGVAGGEKKDAIIDRINKFKLDELTERIRDHEKSQIQYQ